MWWLFPIAFLSINAAIKTMTAETALSKGEQRRLNRLLPHVREKMLQLKKAMQKRGLQIWFGSTSRSLAQQEKNLAEGRAATRRSWHLLNRAGDVYLRDPATGKIDVKAKRLDLYEALHEEAKKLGFNVLGTRLLRGKKTTKHPKGRPFRDPYHIDYRDGMTWKHAFRHDRRERRSKRANA